MSAVNPEMTGLVEQGCKEGVAPTALALQGVSEPSPYGLG